MTRTRIVFALVVAAFLLATLPAAAAVAINPDSTTRNTGQNPEGWLNPPLVLPGPIAIKHPSTIGQVFPQPGPEQGQGGGAIPFGFAGATKSPGGPGAGVVSAGISGPGLMTSATPSGLAGIDAIENRIREARRALDR